VALPFRSFISLSLLKPVPVKEGTILVQEAYLWTSGL